MNYNKKGFTLIELLVVIALIGVILVLSAPKVSDLVFQFKENKKEKIVLNNIEVAAKMYYSENKSDVITDEVKQQCETGTDEILDIDIKASTLIEKGYLKVDSSDTATATKKAIIQYNCKAKKIVNFVTLTPTPAKFSEELELISSSSTSKTLLLQYKTNATDIKTTSDYKCYYGTDESKLNDKAEVNMCSIDTTDLCCAPTDLSSTPNKKYYFKIVNEKTKKESNVDNESLIDINLPSFTVRLIDSKTKNVVIDYSSTNMLYNYFYFDNSLTNLNATYTGDDTLYECSSRPTAGFDVSSCSTLSKNLKFNANKFYVLESGKNQTTFNVDLSAKINVSIFATTTDFVNSRAKSFTLSPVDNTCWDFEVLSDDTIKLTAFKGFAYQTQKDSGIRLGCERSGNSGYVYRGYEGSSSRYSIYIPAEYNGMKVSTLGNKLFNVYEETKGLFTCTNLTYEQIIAINIAEGITTIEDGHFHSGDSAHTNYTTYGTFAGIGLFLTDSKAVSVSFPSTLTKIGEAAFFGTYVNNITIPSNVVTIGKGAFAHTDRLSQINFTKATKLKTIENYAFYSSSINTVTQGTLTLPGSLTKIGDHAISHYDCADDCAYLAVGSRCLIRDIVVKRNKAGMDLGTDWYVACPISVKEKTCTKKFLFICSEYDYTYNNVTPKFLP